MLHQNHVFAVRCGPRMLPDYLAFYSASSMGKRYFLGSAKQTTNLASINATQLRHFPLPLPSLTEQQSITAVLNGLQGRLLSHEDKRVRLQSLKKALMQDLLTGRVRVRV